jgi:YggT family protein
MSTDLLFAITRGDLADYVHALYIVYLILILVRVLMSWIPRIPYNPVLRSVLEFVQQVTDPYLNLFRRILPPIGGGGFAIDLSPILAILLLGVVGSVVEGLIRG